MISLESARKLKDAGLVWRPVLLDHFAIPERGMDDKVFVISDMLVTIEALQGMEVVAFQGASEWALDSLIMSETVWMPREDQLRMALEAALLAAGRPEVRLATGLGGARVDIVYQDQNLGFEAADVSEAYAAALLHLLSGSPSGEHHTGAEG